MSRVRVLCFVVFSAFFSAAPAARAQMAPRPEWKRGHRVRIKIDSIPQGAAIFIDSKDYGLQGITPSEIRLPKGTYKIMLTLEGYNPDEHVINVTGTMAPLLFQLARQVRPAVLEVGSAGDGSAAGGAIAVDGTPVGVVPNRVEVAAGNHTLEVKKPGFHDYRDTLQVAEGERRTVVIALVAQPRPGTLLVSADVQGADVYVDGTRRDSAPAVVGDLAEGDHTVEVRKDGTNAVPFKQVIHVMAGQETKVFAQLQPAAPPPPPAPTGGSIRVLSQTPMADVLVDGEPKGPVNAEIKDLRPGIHIVEVRAKGFDPRRVEVEVRVGELRAVPVDLAPTVAARQTAGIRVISDIPDVDVFIDGAPLGRAPIDRGDLAPGHHFIVAHRGGYDDFKTEIDLQPGKTVEVAAMMRAVGSLKVTSNPPGADVFIDGATVGKTPAALPSVAAGDHTIDIKMPSFVDGHQVVRVQPGQEALVALDLVGLTQTPDYEQKLMAQSSFGATTLPQARFNVDFGVGYPDFFMARLITGIFQYGTFGGDIGVELRTSFLETDIGIRPRVQFWRRDPIAVGFDLAFLGGGGPTKRNSFDFEAGPIVTLIAGSRVHLNFKPYLWVTTDRLCPSVSDIQADDAQSGRNVTDAMGKAVPVPGSGNLYASENTICKTNDKAAAMVAGSYQLPGITPSAGAMNPTFGQTDPRERFVTARFMLQLSLEVAINRNFSLWALIEGAPGQDQRQAFTNKFNSVYPANDFPFYGRAGLTGKF